MCRRLFNSLLFTLLSTALVNAQTPVLPSGLDSSATSSSSEFQGGFLQAPVDARFDSPRPAAIPSQDIRPVRADLPEELPRPARMTGVRTASGERGVQASNDNYDRPIPPPSKSDPNDLFVRSRKADRDRGEEPRAKRTNLDEPQVSDRDRRRESNRLRDLFDGGTGLFQSDDCFSHMISPVTNPFLFEDPRSLTEVRPTFLYQRIPNGQPNFQGGHLWYFGGSARLAINDRWSVTLNKLGAVSVNPGGGSAIPSELGFGEIHLGPKFTFLRDTQTETVAAAGVIFQIPFGSSKVFQDTGKLSIVPYVTGAQTLFDTRYGNVNGVVAAGYSLSTNRDRSDFFYASGNVNFDVGNMHRFYPLVEAHWFYTTTNGKERPGFGFEGRDFANIGGSAKGSNLFTTAFGARYKISERAQIGGAYELPVFGNRDLFRYRFTLDFILRF